ncbi:MAG: MotA/TolQ/ExbB proton channel family protein [Myxococcales bacterium]|nr:MotA/TolQ/ExbB proton channel family protein [Myxococcales bacterium]
MSFFLDGFEKGGIFMWPILLCALSALTISAERFLYIVFRAGVHGPNFMGQVQRHLLDADSDAAMRLCNAEPAAALPRLVKAALLRADRPDAEVRDAIEEATLEVTPQVNRWLPFLPMIANVSTLIGLLGTIHGLIMAFEGVGQADAVARSEMLSTGIAVAMYATFFGLLVSIPTLVVHAVLAARANAILDELDHYGLRMLNLLNALRVADEPPGGAPVLPFAGR